MTYLSLADKSRGRRQDRSRTRDHGLGVIRSPVLYLPALDLLSPPHPGGGENPAERFDLQCGRLSTDFLIKLTIGGTLSAENRGSKGYIMPYQPHRPLQQAGAAFVVAAVFSDLARAHLRVAVEHGAFQPLALHGPRALDPCSHGRRPLPQRRRHKFFIRQRRHLDVQIDAVEQRPGDARTVRVHVVRRAAAGAQAIPPEAALAGLRCLSAVFRSKLKDQ